MTRDPRRTGRLSALLAVALAGGTLLGACEIRLSDAVADGTRLFVAQVLSPENLVPIVLPDDTAAKDAAAE